MACTTRRRIIEYEAITILTSNRILIALKAPVNILLLNIQSQADSPKHCVQYTKRLIMFLQSKRHIYHMQLEHIRFKPIPQG